mgnify:CR=1 FL=1
MNMESGLLRNFMGAFKKLRYMDFPLLFVTMSLYALSVFIIFGIGQKIEMLAIFWIKQTVWVAVGFVLMLIVASIDYETLGKFNYLSYAVSIILLILVLVIGYEVNGAKSWIRLPGATLQPSELAKPATIMTIAWLATRPRTHLGQLTHVFPVLALSVLPMLLIALQPDAGSLLVFIPITICCLFFSGIAKRFLIYPFLLGLILAPILYGQLKPHQKKRINVFLHPMTHPVSVFWARRKAFEGRLPVKVIARIESMRDPIFFVETELAFKAKTITKEEYERIANPNILVREKKLSRKEADSLYYAGKTYVTLKKFIQRDSWQAHQSLLAVGSGGLMGKGWMQGEQHTLGFLPSKVSPTDCIFSVIGEEFGFYKSALIVFLLFFTLVLIVRIACVARDLYGRVIVLCIGGMFLTHCYINIGMAMGIAPIIGIPLPFISYGGSFVVSTFICLGLLQSVYIRRNRSMSLGNVEVL